MLQRSSSSGPELAPVDELLGRYRRYLLVERDLEPLTVVG
jgi:hypothetical protein